MTPRRRWLLVGVGVCVLALAATGVVAAVTAGGPARVASQGPVAVPVTPSAPATASPSPSKHPRRHRHGPRHHKSHTHSPPPPTSTSPYPGGGPLVPASGALLGAYVNPPQYTAADEISAVRTFQDQTGHKLALVHTYHPWTNKFPSPADAYFADNGQVLLLTWGGTPSTVDVINGRYDAMIRQRAIGLKDLGRPVLLEFRHEMDRPDLQSAMHSPADYIAAWKHIRAIFTSVGATNVSWVWCPTAWGFATGRAEAFYPGNDEVNWICADAYSGNPSEPLSTVIGPFLKWAAAHPKPIVLGEFGVAGDKSGWASWLGQVGEMVRQHPQIKALAYFDSTGSVAHGQTLTGDQPAVSEFGSLLRQSYFTPPTSAYPES
ncbi:MAG TPA: hypothetical protein VGG35_26145 [Streptosporangiaceae bacterium]